ncbi:hypothetical protein BN1058_01483 [Paraliobacillus sp. PM-2]|uniref:hypothetical protein n=1 Tax=Paraliobacillus sp. PM-2 TaxID=1462524 RepID=UPI00061CB375|nr:hypothetical protein [Paraliobacillus sp. PM-2]CQR47192.1 hypothetical protein BN1058_01483 [Paraliobacillus sp. PM-2]
MIYKAFLEDFSSYKKEKVGTCFLITLFTIFVCETIIFFMGYELYYLLYDTPLFIATYVICYRYLYNRNLMNIEKIKQSKNQYNNTVCKITISDEGFTREFSDLVTKNKWSDIKMVKEDERRYFLFISEYPRKLFVLKKYPLKLNEKEIKDYNVKIRKGIDDAGLNIIRM